MPCAAGRGQATSPTSYVTVMVIFPGWSPKTNRGLDSNGSATALAIHEVCSSLSPNAIDQMTCLLVKGIMEIGKVGMGCQNT